MSCVHFLELSPYSLVNSPFKFHVTRRPSLGTFLSHLITVVNTQLFWDYFTSVFLINAEDRSHV